MCVHCEGLAGAPPPAQDICRVAAVWAKLSMKMTDDAEAGSQRHRNSEHSLKTRDLADPPRNADIIRRERRKLVKRHAEEKNDEVTTAVTG